MSTLLDAKLLSRFSLQDMLSFLGYKTQEWMQVNARPGWNVFVSTESLSSKELEIALPAFEDVHTTPVYLASALDLLSSVYEEEPEIIAQRIEKYDLSLIHISEPTRPY